MAENQHDPQGLHEAIQAQELLLAWLAYSEEHQAEWGQGSKAEDELSHLKFTTRSYLAHRMGP